MESLSNQTINLMSLKDEPLKLGPLYGDKTLIGIMPENQKAYGAKKGPCEYDG